MNKYWVLGVVVLAVSLGNIGCVSLDKHQALQKAHRTLAEQLSQTQQDLQDAETMLRQKDNDIDGLKKQLDAKSETVTNLMAESAHLREALDKAQAILEKQAGLGPGQTVIVKGPALPAPLHNALKEFARQYPDQIEYLEKQGAVRWKADLLFALGSDQVSGSTEALQKFAEIVTSSAASAFDVIIVGHTCKTPIKKAATLAEHKTNWHLSGHRSIAIMELLAGCSVPMTRMGIMGYGEHRPIADNESDSGKARNRRVEIFLVPKESIQAVGQGVYETDTGIAFIRPTAPDEPASEGEPGK